MDAAPSSSVGLKPLLVAQFFGAFNDNAWKLLVIILAGRSVEAALAPGAAPDGATLESVAQTQAMLAFSVFTIPLILFSLPAGVLSDRLSKRTVVLATKTLEVVLMSLGTLALVLSPTGSFWPLVVLGLMGVQSALFGPAKYGILPELVSHDRLSYANGALELWSFLAIILGTVMGPRLVATAGSQPAWAGLVLGLLAVAGLVAARGIPRLAPARHEGGLKDTLTAAWFALRADRPLGLAVIGSACFWSIASLLGQDILVYTRVVLGLSESNTGLPLALFGLGVGGGSWLAGRLSDDKVEVGLIPLGAVGLGGFTLLLGLLPPAVTSTFVLMALLGVSSGLLLVPLNALVQWRSPADRRGAVIALSNVFSFTGMLIGSLLGWQMAASGLSSRGILVGAALLTLTGTAWALWLLPSAFLRLMAFFWTHVVYRVHVVGREHVPHRGGVLLAPNHVSYVDGLFLMATLDRPVRFIIDQDQFNRPLFKPLLKIMGAIPISSSGGTRELLRALRDAGEALGEGQVVCIFPEGQITRTGSLQPFRRGIERIARGRSAPIVPVHLDRVWGSIFSFKGGRFVRKLPEQLPYPITVSYGEPRASDTSLAELHQAVADLGEQAWYARKPDRPALHRSFARRVRRGPWRLALADATRPRVSRLGALAGAVALARALRAEWSGPMAGERSGAAAGPGRVGIMLPPSVAGALVNLAASLAGRTSVHLNYTTGVDGMGSAARQAGLRHVVTSRAFLDQAGIQLPDGLQAVFMEDLRERIGWPSRLAALALALAAPVRLIERACGAQRAPVSDDLATIIFSSGSTGEPKGVMLSHFNVDSNVEAVDQVFRLGQSDSLLGILPLFHSFGYLSSWFALNHGAPLVFHPSPLDAPGIGQLVHRHGVTVMLATPTFLQLYLRRCTPEQFGSLRIVLAGAEKLSDALATAFEQRFGIRPLEGYGTTECSPVIATSVPAFRARGFFQSGSKRGFVGLPLPGVAVRIVDPDTRQPLPAGTSGLLLVRGPNVMQGYLGRPDLTAKVLQDGWYDTGDIALLDDEGFLKITDRLSRFSKIGGEMVPHGRVEEALHEAFGADGTQRFAVTAIPDERKGERLAVLTTIAAERVPGLLEDLAAAGLPNLYIPRGDSFVVVDAIPALGTGKVDLKAVKQRALEALGKGAA